eukprot:4825627-Pleurochrysis_carterae.AAC.1
MAAGSDSAAESAVADWRELLARAGGTNAMGWTQAPLGWPAAAQRVVQVLRRASAAGAGGPRGGAGAPGGEADLRRAEQQRHGGGSKEAPGATAKLGAL